MSLRMFQSALAIVQQKMGRPWSRLSSGMQSLDKLLDGGFEVGLSYLLYGSSLCTSILLRCIAAALPQVAPAGGDVIVIDGSSRLHPLRLLRLIGGRASFSLTSLSRTSPPPDMKPAYLLGHLRVVQAFSASHLLHLLDGLPHLLYRLDVPIIFVTDLSHLMDREPNASKVLAKIAVELKMLAFTLQVAVVASEDDEGYGGVKCTVARHAFHVLLRHTRSGSTNIFTLEKHPSLPYRRSISSLCWEKRGSSALDLKRSGEDFGAGREGFIFMEGKG